MKKYLITILFVLLSIYLFSNKNHEEFRKIINKNTFKECTYSVYRYKSNAILIKFDCTVVKKIHITIKNNNSLIINDIVYLPIKGENVFVITFLNDLSDCFLITIEYQNELLEYIYCNN